MVVIFWLLSPALTLMVAPAKGVSVSVSTILPEMLPVGYEVFVITAPLTMVVAELVTLIIRLPLGPSSHAVELSSAYAGSRLAAGGSTVR
ncbi:MAG: hypothetical protein BWY32_03455 [bacterium ADurb.Bin243]|nr:MAG: hypothetical protein BWY32_03455 [bacterium ADurb.Bin243]